jgi:hypothetical protein
MDAGMVETVGAAERSGEAAAHRYVPGDEETGGATSSRLSKTTPPPAAWRCRYGRVSGLVQNGIRRFARIYGGRIILGHGVEIRRPRRP